MKLIWTICSAIAGGGPTGRPTGAGVGRPIHRARENTTGSSQPAKSSRHRRGPAKLGPTHKNPPNFPRGPHRRRKPSRKRGGPAKKGQKPEGFPPGPGTGERARGKTFGFLAKTLRVHTWTRTKKPTTPKTRGISPGTARPRPPAAAGGRRAARGLESSFFNYGFN